MGYTFIKLLLYQVLLYQVGFVPVSSAFIVLTTWGRHPEKQFRVCKVSHRKESNIAVKKSKRKENKSNRKKKNTTNGKVKK
jgi:hypothetical protein